MAVTKTNGVWGSGSLSCPLGGLLLRRHQNCLVLINSCKAAGLALSRGGRRVEREEKMKGHFPQRFPSAVVITQSSVEKN